MASRERQNLTHSEDVRSPSLPGGSLLAALLNRPLMTLADRGSSSALVGGRWADLAADHARQLVGSAIGIPFAGDAHVIERIVRLDDEPRIASRASRLGLQNPDMILFGRWQGESTMQAVDAKFSVETARSKQVSAEMLGALQTMGQFLDDAVGGIDPAARLLPGFFISPDSALTRYIIRRRKGITRLTVQPEEELRLFPVSASQMFAGVEGVELFEPLYRLDRHDANPATNVIAGLYYFRLARAAMAASSDIKRPLLTFNDKIVPSVEVVRLEVLERASGAKNAYQLLMTWTADADRVNTQRAAIERAAGLPVANRVLREWIIEATASNLDAPPSMNQVRRNLGAWYRRELRERIGPVMPPQQDITPVLTQIGAIAREVVPLMRAKAFEVAEMLAASRNLDETDTIPLPQAAPASRETATMS